MEPEVEHARPVEGEVVLRAEVVAGLDTRGDREAVEPRLPQDRAAEGLPAEDALGVGVAPAGL